MRVYTLKKLGNEGVGFGNVVRFGRQKSWDTKENLK